MRMVAAAVVGIVAAAVIVGCSSPKTQAEDQDSEPGDSESGVSEATVSKPAAQGAAERFDYQLGGASERTDIDTVVRDSTAQPLPGAYSICYVNGFQTQPGVEWDPRLLLTDTEGVPVIDPEWPDEYILDPRTEESRSGIDAVIGPIIEDCAAKGFDAVEIDNLDTWTRFPDSIDENSALELARLYANRAHASGMEIAQKNAPDGAARIKADVGFDFAIAEECLAFDECSSYTAAYGSRVYDVEYTDNLDTSFEALCEQSDRPAVTILRDRNLTLPSNPDYIYQQC